MWFSILVLVAGIEFDCQRAIWGYCRAQGELDIRVEKQLLWSKPGFSEHVVGTIQREWAQIGLLPMGSVQRKYWSDATVWVSENSEPGLSYHDSVDWLRANNRPPAMMGGIEIENARDYLSFAERGLSPLLHEFAHVLHHQMYDWDQTHISMTYQRMQTEPKLRQADNIWDDEKRPAYALSDERELFAEFSEAWFGRNDVFPFNREDLMDLDPGLADLFHSVWGRP